MKDFVEIYPVTETKEGFVPVYDDAARSANTLDVTGPGKFDFSSNPDFVHGAYVNLRHHAVREAIEARGLTFKEGETHRIEIDSETIYLQTNTYVAGTPNLQTSGLLAGSIGAAARAGAKRGATHVEIKIS